MIVGDFNTQPSLLDRSSRQKKFFKETSELNRTIDQMDLSDVYRVFHPAGTQYIFFSAVHRTFSKTDHNLEHKAILSKHN
jgi:exonuclease III